MMMMVASTRSEKEVERLATNAADTDILLENVPLKTREKERARRKDGKKEAQKGLMLQGAREERKDIP